MMKTLIEELRRKDQAFYRHYLDMLVSIEHNGAVTPWQLSMLLWRARLFRVTLPPPGHFKVSIATEQEKDEVRFMKGWKFKLVCKYLSPWQVRQCTEIREERWR